MIKVNSLDHIVLTVKSIEKTVEFYTKVLGMKKELFNKSRVALRFGNSKINLHELGREFEPKAFNTKEGSADLCFIIETPLEDAKEYIENLGINIEDGIVKRTGALGQIDSIYLRDPDKNLIELSNYRENEKCKQKQIYLH